MANSGRNTNRSQFYFCLLYTSYDTVDETNLNRQLISSVDSIGKLKVDVAKARRRRINPNITVNAYNMFVDRDNLDFIKELGADYIIDAFDTVKAKLSLIEFCHKNNIKIISAMGTHGGDNLYIVFVAKFNQRQFGLNGVKSVYDVIGTQFFYKI